MNLLASLLSLYLCLGPMPAEEVCEQRIDPQMLSLAEIVKKKSDPICEKTEAGYHSYCLRLKSGKNEYAITYMDKSESPPPEDTKAKLLPTSPPPSATYNIVDEEDKLNIIWTTEDNTGKLRMIMLTDVGLNGFTGTKIRESDQCIPAPVDPRDSFYGMNIGAEAHFLPYLSPRGDVQKMQEQYKEMVKTVTALLR